MKIINKKTIVMDVTVLIIFILALSVRFLTMFYVNQVVEISGTTIEQVSTLYETNPLAKYLLGIEMFKYIIISLIIPAFGTAFYLVLRKNVIKGKIRAETLGYYLNFFLFLMLLNFMNDLGAYIGVMM